MVFFNYTSYKILALLFVNTTILSNLLNIGYYTCKSTIWITKKVIENIKYYRNSYYPLCIEDISGESYIIDEDIDINIYDKNKLTNDIIIYEVYDTNIESFAPSAPLIEEIEEQERMFYRY